MLEAEQLLMATGLLEPPTRTHVLAARSLLIEQRRMLIEVLRREEPWRLYVCPPRTGYFQRLVVQPDYTAYSNALEPLVGAQVADTYNVIHQRARQALIGLRPVSTIQTVVGPIPMPLDAISAGRWAIEVDVIEGLRLVKDMGAGGLLREEIDVFRAAFPDTYRYLDQVLDDWLNKRKARQPTWAPPMWLADSIRVFKGLPFDASLEVKGPEAPEAAPPSKPRKAPLKTDDLKTRGQSVS